MEIVGDDPVSEGPLVEGADGSVGVASGCGAGLGSGEDEVLDLEAAEFDQRASGPGAEKAEFAGVVGDGVDGSAVGEPPAAVEISRSWSSGVHAQTSLGRGSGWTTC